MKLIFLSAKNFSVFVIFISLLFLSNSNPQDVNSASKKAIDVSGFYDSAHHWKDITDHEQFIVMLPDQKKYEPTQVKEIADNIFLYQQKNGGFPKNYDMMAILTPEQKAILKEGRDSLRTTFDNGATHSQVEYLAKAYALLKDKKYADAALRGIHYMLEAQYPNGGFPQFYPDTSGYRKYITFNDGAMIGIMRVFKNIVTNDPDFSFVDKTTRAKVKIAYEKGLDCILKCQIVENGKLTVWCQQHDEINFKPRGARTFELPSKCGDESADIVLFLMSIKHPSKAIVNSIKSAVEWFKESELHGIREKTIKAPKVVFKYRTSVTDRIVVKDPKAPPVWARFYTLKDNKPFFCDRNGIPVYSLAQVGRERRDGYTWYNYEPQKALDKYSSWLKRISQSN